jgi:mitochondrial fission protein ELM1
VNHRSSTPTTAAAAVVWQVMDAKPGHRNQVLGLTEGLQRCIAIHPLTVDIKREWRGLRCWLPGRLAALKQLPEPDLLIAAGHATHLPLLRLKQQFGGKSVVLMKPSLPFPCFDLCLVPNSHSLRRQPDNVEFTEGAINRVAPSQELDPDRGLVLVGGPSAHFEWSDTTVLDQIQTVIARNSSIQWTVATSRRTPASFVDGWKQRRLAGVLVPATATTPDWLPRQLQTTQNVWVTADSVSMLYEAMTAGAAVGVLELPSNRPTRVTNTVRRLCAQHTVTSFSQWQTGQSLLTPTAPLCESDRCARLVIDRLLPGHTSKNRAA